VAIGSGEGADFRAPLGRAVIGGVITSTVLTLLVIPTVYDILSQWRDGAMVLFKRLARAKQPARSGRATPATESSVAPAAAGPAV
jgi:HAE1 family hydrophobic/amphiphilic exporter-1